MDLLIRAVDLGFTIYTWMIIIYILMSWVPASRETSIGQWLAKMTEPYLEVFRKIIPPLGMIDFSPIVAILALSLIRAGFYMLVSFFM